MVSNANKQISFLHLTKIFLNQNKRQAATINIVNLFRKLVNTYFQKWPVQFMTKIYH